MRRDVTKRLFRSPIVWLAAALLPAPAPAAAQLGDDVLRPGDQVVVEVWRNPELSGEMLVDQNGRLVHPLYQQIVVSDIPISDVERRIRDFLLQYEADPQVTVQPMVRVAVGGQVVQPDLFNVPPETTVIEVVAMAGGVNANGKWDDVQLIRDGRSQKLDLTDPMIHTQDIRVRSGDQLIVARRSTAFRDVVAPVASVTAAIAALIVAVGNR